MKKLILAVAGLTVASAAFAQGGSAPQNGSQTGSDAQTAAMIRTVNDAEIAQAKIAERSAKSREVKQFARMMARDHARNNAELAAAQKQANIEPSSNEEVQSLRSQTQQTTQQLESQAGQGFDDSYMQSQVQEHQDALKKLDQAVSSSSNPTFRRFVAKTRQAVAKHLKEAKSVIAKLGAATQPSGGNQ